MFSVQRESQYKRQKQCSTFSVHLSLSTFGNPDAKQVVAFCGPIGAVASPVALSPVMCQRQVAVARFRLRLRVGDLVPKGQAQSPLL